MGKYRFDVSQRQITFELLNGRSVRATAMKFGCSEALVRNVREGKRKEPPVRAFIVTIPAGELCQCCGERRIAEGNRYLCTVCFTTAECGVIY